LIVSKIKSLEGDCEAKISYLRQEEYPFSNFRDENIIRDVVDLKVDTGVRINIGQILQSASTLKKKTPDWIIQIFRFFSPYQW
jgi:hypothetical protein